MQNAPTLCLHFPVTVRVEGRDLRGELYLPKSADTLRICIVRENEMFCRRLGALLTNGTTATLALHSKASVSAGEMIGIVDWARSRQLLRSLAIRIIAPASDNKALQKAALMRPAAVSA